MENSRWDPNAQIICPYDITHVISVKRFQRHLVKCRQNHPDKDFVTCPFNARHMFLRIDLRKHLSHCADRVTLDPDVMQEEDPETGEMLRLKGKTEMPKAPENIPNSTEDWDDEIEENLAVKYAEQEEYFRLQGIIAKQEEEPILRRPTLPIVNKPNLPVVNKPVNFTENGYLTSLRRPNLSTIERTKTAGISSMNSATSMNFHKETEVSSNSNSAPTDSVYLTSDIQKTIVSEESLNHVDAMEDKIWTSESHIRNGVSPKTNLDDGACHNTEIKLGNYVPLTSNKTKLKCYKGLIKDCDTESMTSDGSWASSVYEPLKRYSNKSFINPSPTEYDEDTSTRSKDMSPGLKDTSSGLQVTVSGLKDTVSCLKDKPSHDVEHKGNGVAKCNTIQSVARGNLFRSLEGSAFTPVIPKQTIGAAINPKPAVGRGLMNGHNNYTPLSNIDDKLKKGLGRGNLKLAAIHFQAP